MSQGGDGSSQEWGSAGGVLPLASAPTLQVPELWGRTQWELQEGTWRGVEGGHGDGTHHPGGEQGKVIAAPGDSPSGCLPSELVPRQWGTCRSPRSGHHSSIYGATRGINQVEEQGRVQALAGGAARVGGREGAAAAQTKPAAAADGTVMLLSLGAAAGTPGPPCICTEPCSASPPGLLGAISAQPSAHPLARGGGQGGQGEGISGCREQGLRGHRAAPSQGTTPAPTRGPPLDLPGTPGTRQVQCRDPDPAPARAAAGRDLAGNSWAGAALLVITN